MARPPQTPPVARGHRSCGFEGRRQRFSVSGLHRTVRRRRRSSDIISGSCRNSVVVPASTAKWAIERKGMAGRALHRGGFCFACGQKPKFRTLWKPPLRVSAPQKVPPKKHPPRLGASRQRRFRPF